MSDTLYRVSPALWSVEVLVSHGHQVVRDLARDAASSSSTMRYLLGRCLLAMERLGSHKEMGLSSPVHFATQHLKMNQRAAKTVLRVSRRLEQLPLLAQAVLKGEIGWSQIREVVSVATVDTEEMWKELCLKFNCRQIQALVEATPRGGVPGEVAARSPRKTSEYRCRFEPEVVVLIERGLQKMSRKIGKPIMFREAVERFFTELLADKPYDEAAEKMLEEARRDFLAGRIQQEPLVEEAREIARETGVLQDLEEARTGVEEPEDTPGALAKQAMDSLQTAIGGELPFEVLDDSEQGVGESSHVGISGCHSTPADEAEKTPADNSNLTATGSSSPSHVGNPNSEQERLQPSPTQPEPLKQTTTRPTSKVTPLRPPFPKQAGAFQPQAPALLKALMARLKFNPDSRFPSKAQRKALLRRDGYCCRTPGCTNHLFLEIHHIVRYCQGGKTLPQFLLTLCSRCHKNTEEGKLHIRHTESGKLLFTDQHGNDLEEGQRLDRAIWLDYWLGWQGKKTDSHWARAVGFSKAVA